MVNTYRNAAQGPALDDGAVRSHEDGIVFPTDIWMRLQRFLILGSAQGTFYVAPKTLTLDSADAVRVCLAEDGLRTIREITEISDSGRAVSQDPALFALAMAASDANLIVRDAALFTALPRVCRTGTHLLHFVSFCKPMRKSSRMYRRALANWFNRLEIDRLAYQAVKYRSRDGWALADVLRLSRPKPPTPAYGAVYKWLVDGEAAENAPAIIRATSQAAATSDIAEIATLVRAERLPREAVPTEFLNSPEVWEALLQDMPITAMIRNLGKMTNVGLIANGSDAARQIADRITDPDRLVRGRVHPLSLLVALKVYEQGAGDRGSLKWTAVKKIANALDEAFYLAFGTVPTSGKRIRLAIDVSTSMIGSRIGTLSSVNCRVASAAMALVTAAAEPNASFVAYSDGIVPLDIRPTMRLDEVIRAIEAIPMGGTICSLPIRQALAAKESFDAFFSYTDSETFDGSGPTRIWRTTEVVNLVSYQTVLGVYRDTVNAEAKSAVIAMTSNGFSLNNPQDPNGLDVVGFDTATPFVLSDFLSVSA